MPSDPHAAISARAGVVVPIRAFSGGQARLVGTLDDAAREELGRDLATRVVTAASPLPVAIVSDAPEVRTWARMLGVDALLDDPGSLDGAARAGVAWCRSRGLPRAVIAHADLPWARSFLGVAHDGSRPTVAIVPCHRDDGSPVLSVPARSEFTFSYGEGSFRRHVAEAHRRGLAVRVVRDRTLTFDVDVPSDLVKLGGIVAGAPLTVPAVTVPPSALAIGAHPDDIEFGCGGTIAKWSRAGCVVEILVLTDGSKGSWDPAADLDDLVEIRRAEQDAAARALGARRIHLLGETDGELVADTRTREAVCGVIRGVRPHTVIGHDPWKRYRLHPDHREAGRLTVEGIVAARDPHFFAHQREAPHRPARLLLFEPDEIDHLEPLEPRDVRSKLDALWCHRSQWRSTMGVEDGPDVDGQRAAFETKIIGDLEAHGSEIGIPAEPFKLMTDL